VSETQGRATSLPRNLLSASLLAALLLITSAPSALAQDVYVTGNHPAGSLVLNTQTNQVVAPEIEVGGVAVAITPDGRSAYLLGSRYVSVLNTQTNQVLGSPIEVGEEAYAAAITPDGDSAYVVNRGSNNVSVIDTLTNEVVGSPITVGEAPDAIAISPNEQTAYVTNYASNNVSVIDTATNEVLGSPIGVGEEPDAIAITPDGKSAYVVNGKSNSVSVIDTATNEVLGSPIGVGEEPDAIAITPDGKSLYVVSRGSKSVSAIETATNEVLGSPISVGEAPNAIAITPDAKSAYVVNGKSNTVSVIDTATNEVLGSPIGVGERPKAIAITPDQPPLASFSVPIARAGMPVTFDASASSYPEGSTPSFNWEFGDGSTEEDAGPSPSHIFNTPGTYGATLTVTDNVCSSEFIFTGQTAYCNGSAPLSRTLPVIVAGPATSVQVSLSPPSIFANGSSTTTATAKVTDPHANPVPGDEVAFSSSDSGEQIGAVSEPSPGTYTATVTSSTSEGEPTITATDDSLSPPIQGNARLIQEIDTPIRIGRLRRIVRDGKAKLEVIVPGPGTLSIIGAQIEVLRIPIFSGPVSLLITAKGRAARILHRTGKALVRVTISFTPTFGVRSSKSITVKLVEKRLSAA